MTEEDIVKCANYSYQAVTFFSNFMKEMNQPGKEEMYTLAKKGFENAVEIHSSTDELLKAMRHGAT